MELPFQHNRLPKTDAWGKPKSVTDWSLFHALFTFDIPKTIWAILEDSVAVTSSTNATSTGGMLKMDSTGLTRIEVRSYRHPRYQPNRGILYSASWILPDFAKDAIFEFGLFNTASDDSIESGLFFRARAGKLYAVRVTLGVEHATEIQFPAGADLTKGCLYDIQGQWRGIGSFLFLVTTEKGTTTTILPLLGTLDAISIDNPAMSVAQRITPVTQDGVMYCGCIDYTSEGGVNERLQYASAYVLDNTVNSGQGVIAIRTPERIGTRINSRDCQLVRISIQADKKADYSLYLCRDPACVTATGWTAINNGSYIEKADSITAVDIASAQFVSVFAVAAGAIVERNNPFPEKIDFYLTGGTICFIRCESGTGVSTTVVFEMGEEV